MVDEAPFLLDAKMLSQLGCDDALEWVSRRRYRLDDIREGDARLQRIAWRIAFQGHLSAAANGHAFSGGTQAPSASTHS